MRSKSRWVVGETEWTSAKRKGEPWSLQAFQEVSEADRNRFSLLG